MNSLPNDINPGILPTVVWLREHGYNTMDSGDGKTHDHACDLPVPYVHIRVDKPDNLVPSAIRLKHRLEDVGIILEPQNETGTAPSMECSYNPAENFAIISLFNIVLP